MVIFYTIIVLEYYKILNHFLFLKLTFILLVISYHWALNYGYPLHLIDLILII